MQAGEQVGDFGANELLHVRLPAKKSLRQAHFSFPYVHNFWYDVFMRWPFAQKAAEKLEPEPEPGPAERERALVVELGGIDAQLRELETECFRFRRTHTLRVNAQGQVIGMHADSATAWASVDRQWRVLLKKRDSLFPRRNEVLRELAALKVGVHA